MNVEYKKSERGNLRKEKFKQGYTWGKVMMINYS